MTDPKRILFVKYAAIGDVLNATPAIRALRKRFPGAGIDCLVGKWSAPVLERNPNVSKTILFDDGILAPRRFGEALRLAGALRRNRYDMTVCLHRSLAIHAWVRLIGAPVRLGFVNSPLARVFVTHALQEDAYKDTRQHEIEYYNELVSRVGASDGVAMDFHLPETTPKVRDFLAAHFRPGGRRRVGMCAGGARNLVASETRRQWFLESYLEVIRSMPECDFVLMGAGFDRYTVEAARAAGLPNAIDGVGMFSLEESAQVMRACDAFITHDTGLLHVASALDVPTVAVFGPTSPARRKPLNANSILLFTGEPCSPCYVPTRNAFLPCGHVSCLRKITPADAARALRSLLGAGEPGREASDG